MREGVTALGMSCFAAVTSLEIDKQSVEELAEALAASHAAIAFTGAGISTESGIPDFRGPNGVWKKVDPAEFTIDNYVNNAEHRARVWAQRAASHEASHEPNDGHRAIVELQRLGIIDAVITQNIDGLHAAAGSHTVLELHGTTREVACLSCGDRQPMGDVVARVRAGDADPHCARCGGLLKSATVSFGQALPADVIEDAFRRARECDFCLVVGSSLVVYPAAGVPIEAKRAGAKLAIVNAEETDLDDQADIVVRGQAGAVLREAVERVRAIQAV
ncbi:MAG TPA: NAD-dependent protein deacylase [Actinomycetota bacterium]|nr:NAD-dependent protein deacylase [Actinomycetota bacterium]